MGIIKKRDFGAEHSETADQDIRHTSKMDRKTNLEVLILRDE